MVDIFLSGLLLGTLRLRCHLQGLTGNANLACPSVLRVYQMTVLPLHLVDDILQLTRLIVEVAIENFVPLLLLRLLISCLLAALLSSSEVLVVAVCTRGGEYPREIVPSILRLDALLAWIQWVDTVSHHAKLFQVLSKQLSVFGRDLREAIHKADIYVEPATPCVHSALRFAYR